jgi:hypothetical protein
VDAQERKRLNGALAIGNAQQREREYHQEAENQNRNCGLQIPRRRPYRNARKQQCNADQSDERARHPEFPHVLILSEISNPSIAPEREYGKGVRGSLSPRTE